MTSQSITSDRPFPTAVLILSVCGLGLLAAAAATGILQFAVGAVLPLALAIGLFFARTGDFVAEMTESGLSLTSLGTEIAYQDIESLNLAGAPQDPHVARLKTGPLTLVFRHRSVEIPGRLNVPVEELYRHLLERIPTAGSRQVHPDLAGYLREQEETFGADRVATFVSRSRMGCRPSKRGGKAVGLALLVTAIAWFVAPLIVKMGQDAKGGWIGCGVLLAIAGFSVWLGCKLAERHPATRIRQKGKCSLIISPVGIAMVQGDLSGRLRWDEIRNIRLGKRPRGVYLTGAQVPAGGLSVYVEGAVIHIADIYDRPLPIIHALIQRNWQPA